MRLIVISRHGESTLNIEKRVNGDPAVPVVLTEHGREAAKLLGQQIAHIPIDLCVHSRFSRTRETAEIALAGRDVPIVVVPELNDHPAGSYEGRPLAEYLEWAHAAGPLDLIPGGADTRAGVIERFICGFRILAGMPEAVVLAVLHSLPIAYLVEAAEGRDPENRMPMLPYAEATDLSRDEVESAVARLERWRVSLT
jgi:2,3-bisphosphoglycerate-dependent phosphoglycerate mutase